MSSVIIAGDVSGTVTLQAPSAAGSTVVTLPSSSMNMGNGGGSVATNTAFGTSALNANTSGAYNTVVGYQAAAANTTGTQIAVFGHRALYANTTGDYNTVFGANALESNTTGANNTALGFKALDSNTTASYNTAVGYQAGYSNTTGTINAFGAGALYNNTTGARNAAFGAYTLNDNSTGSYNSAFGGYDAVAVPPMYRNTTGSYNTAFGNGSLANNTTASNNTAVGYQAGYASTGADNTFLGFQAGYSNTTGATNVFIGDTAGYNATTGTLNTFVGYNSGAQVTTGGKNTILGRYNGNQGNLDIRTSSNYIVLSDGDGNPSAFLTNSGTFLVGGQSRSYDGALVLLGTATTNYGPVVIGTTGNAASNTNQWYAGSNSFIKGGTTYNTYTVMAGTTNGVNLASGGTSWTSASDERLKDIIEPITDAATKVSTLRAVIGKYKTDEEGTRRSFLIAQDVQAVLPEAITESRNSKDDETDYLNIAYTEVIPLLVAAIKELKAEIDTLKGQA